jgi:FKBP-type peptidyl-prolyl cis-trans isomerase FklB
MLYIQFFKEMKMKMKISTLAILCFGLLTNTYAADMAPTSTSNKLSSIGVQPVGAKNQMSGDAYLAANKDKPGVTTLPSGLQYKVLTAGNGRTPTDNDIVTVDYAGTFIDGKEFDSSYKRGTPATFPVTGVIPGWTEALKLMKEGSIWEVYVPSSLAYGEEGAPGAIGPNQTLVFKIHLIKVNKK